VPQPKAGIDAFRREGEPRKLTNLRIDQINRSIE
jgi:hypothetical protein